MNTMDTNYLETSLRPATPDFEGRREVSVHG